MPTLTELLDRYPPEIQALTQELRAFVRQVAPQAEETVRLGWQSLGYRDPQAGYFFGLFLKRDHVQALFEWGALLADADHPLEGNGTQVRYVTVRRLNEPARDMLRGAYGPRWHCRPAAMPGTRC